MIFLLLFQLGFAKINIESVSSWNSQLNQLESTSSRLKERLAELKGYFSVSNHGNIPVLSIEDSMIQVELEIQSLENQIKRLKQP